jgi:ADP-heptose:LPS heptosyltransferase/Flp pilus assembly protein TadD
MKQYDEYYKKAHTETSNNNYVLAIQFYKKALLCKKNKCLNCLSEIGNLYEKLYKFEEAIDYHNKALAFVHDIGKKCILLNQIGICYTNLKDFINALKYFEKILQIKNDIPDVFNNIAYCYLQVKNYKLCEENYYNSLRLNKNNSKVLHALGDLYYYTKKYELSTRFFEKIDNYQINYSLKYNCSFPYLAQKKFAEGFVLYENRLKFNNIDQSNLQQRVEIPQINYWDGNTRCNNLLIVYEQGIGDNIQYYRFIIELAELYPDMKIDYFCKNIIQHIFKKYDNIQIINNVIIQNYDYKIYIMSLPYILKIADIKPNVKNYIQVNYDKIEYWKNELSHLKKYKVGITYKGLLSSLIDKNIPLSEFILLKDNNIDLICIHKHDDINSEDKNLLKDKITFVDIDKDVPFEDTIAILQNIDLLITIDTFIVHLAGVLNIKTWLLLGFVSDWRWFKDDKISHWYNSVELIRMKENKELKYILSEVNEKLHHELRLC